jgi:Fe-S-cluster containining protein
VALEIDPPKSKEDWREIVWYVLHKGVRVFKEDGDWYVEFAGDCDALTPKGLCRVYEERPDICRDYDAETCVKHGEGEHYEFMLETKADVEKHVKKHTKIKKLYKFK